MREIWKDIKGYEGLYQVSNLGRIKSLKRKCKSKHEKRTVKEKIRKLAINRQGYYTVVLSKKGNNTSFRVNRLVAETFISNKKTKVYVNHINCDKLDNNVDNLEWCTARENIQHAVKNNLIKTRGESPEAISVNQYDIEGNFLKNWDCMTTAAEKTNSHISKICLCCRGTRKTTNGYRWKYAD